MQWQHLKPEPPEKIQTNKPTNKHKNRNEKQAAKVFAADFIHRYLAKKTPITPNPKKEKNGETKQPPAKYFTSVCE